MQHSSDATEDRLRALEDERAIIRVLNLYCHTADSAGDFGEVFTDDGVFEVRMADGTPLRRCEGLVAIREYWATRPHPEGRFDKHLVLSPVVTRDGEDRASVESYFAVLQNNNNGVAITYGRYHDTLVRAGGRWLLRERLTDVEVFAPQ